MRLVYTDELSSLISLENVMTEAAVPVPEQPTHFPPGTALFKKKVGS